MTTSAIAVTDSKKTSGDPSPEVINIDASMMLVLGYVAEFLKALNQLQLQNSRWMQSTSDLEAQTAQAFEAAENSATDTFDTTGVHNSIYKIEHNDGDAGTNSATYNADNTHNQSLMKIIDGSYQMWQGATNQNNQNQQSPIAMGNAIVQATAFLSRLLG